MFFCLIHSPYVTREWLTTVLPRVNTSVFTRRLLYSCDLTPLHVNRSSS